LAFILVEEKERTMYRLVGKRKKKRGQGLALAGRGGMATCVLAKERGSSRKTSKALALEKMRRKREHRTVALLGGIPKGNWFELSAS